VKNITHLLNKSAIITKSIGDIRLNNTKIVRDEIKVNGISIWEIAESTLALHIIPELIASRNSKLFLLKKNIYLFVKRILFLFKKFNYVFEIVTNNTKNIWLVISFSDYMYNDIFSPFYHYLNEQNISNHFARVHINRKIVKIDNFKYYNENIQPDYLHKSNNILTKREYKYIINWLFNYFIPLHYSLLLKTEEIFNNNKIDILITADNADPRSRILSLYAKLYKIPIIELQFGQCGIDSTEWFFSLGDKICVWGDRFKDILVNNFKHDENNVIVTGSPRFDYIYNLNNTKFLNLLKNNNVDCKKKVIILASTYTIPGYDSKFDKKILKNFKKLLLDEMSKHPNYIFIVKPHPVESSSLLQNYTRDKKNILYLSKQEDLRNYIPFSNALISFGSTVNYDAIINSKLVISPNNTNLTWYEDVFMDNNICIAFNNMNELREIFNQLYKFEISFNLNVNEFLTKSVKKLDKPSSVEIVNVINNLI
jgi:hypothetical protein